jgi:phosphatidate cytidylyltransferase
MLKTRLLMGAVLVLLIIGVLWFDTRYAPYFPILGLLVGLIGILGVIELRELVPYAMRPHPLLCVFGVLAVLAGPWVHASLPIHDLSRNPWLWTLLIFVGVMAVAILKEMATFYGPSGAIARLSALTFVVAYLGVLPCFLTQLRWLPEGENGKARSTAALILAIFVPKIGDIAAYFIGRRYGKRLLAPVLSPKKTVEGALGGIAATAVFAGFMQLVFDVVRGGVLSALLLGLVMGVVSIFGDLAESLLKRDADRKDASQAVPGFGGVLDVIDSLLFAAPVAYCWLA